MKEILVVRHADWDLHNDTLTPEGRARCEEVRPLLGIFAVVLCGPAGRARETAQLLTGKQPQPDERAGIYTSPSQELSAHVAELRKTHPFGVAGAIISIPELRGPLRQQGEAMHDLVAETMQALPPDQRALIVSHDGTMVALEKVLAGEPFDTIDHTYGELQGFRINENLEIARL